jgi:uncharacterized repeat protein (TIGR03803 family)
MANLTFDGAGNLYGTTYLGGTANQGTVFKLTHITGTGWVETVLHSFLNNGEDGELPSAGVILDNAGNIYGTTQGGGRRGDGTVFEIVP